MPSIEYSRAAAVTEQLEERLVESLTGERSVSRRTVLGGLGVAGSAAVGLGGTRAGGSTGHDHESEGEHGNFGAVGEYRDLEFDPHEFLTAFNTGESGQDNVPQQVYEEDGRTVREFEFVAVDTTITIAPGVEFEAWAYNGQVPGPTIRAVEGDLIRVTFQNLGQHAHTIHPHLKNLNPAMDGIPQNGPGVLDTGESFTYEWVAQPAGVHLYHCHSLPLKEHLHRGLYGAIIVDPDPERVSENPRDYVNYPGPVTDDLRTQLIEEARTRNHEYAENDAVNEMVMVMNSFDTNFDGENEVYAANTRAFAYGVGHTDGDGNWSAGETKRPIQIDRNERQRVYLVNATEFDPINSFHTHSQFFDYYDHGTTLTPTRTNVDTVMQCQAQRGVLEIDYSDHQPGLYMFHAHQSEFAELGWMSFFEVVYMAGDSTTDGEDSMTDGGDSMADGGDSTTDGEDPMADGGVPVDGEPTRPLGLPRWITALLPIVLLVLVLGVFAFTSPLAGVQSGEPLPDLTVTHTTLPDDETVVLHVTNNGPESATISQVLVDEAYWNFQVEGAGGDRTLAPMESAEVVVPYHWNQGWDLDVALVLSDGATFHNTIVAPSQSPGFSLGLLGTLALIGLFVGVIPVALGMLWFPYIRTMSDRWLHAILLFATGVLTFLAFDAGFEAFELAERIPGAYEGRLLVVLGIFGALLLVQTVSAWREGRVAAGDSRASSGLWVAYLVALGIGLHNLAEGLAIGSSFALGRVSLGAFLVIGFMLHNVTEGPAVVAPVARGRRPALWHFAALGLIAGAPVILGGWIGSLAYSPTVGAFFLAVGVGAILQVDWEIARMVRDGGGRVASATNLLAFLLGLAIMYVTDLFVAL